MLEIYIHTVKPLKTGPSETGIPSKPNVFRGPVMFVSFNTKVYPSKPETYLNRTGRINPVPLSTFSKNVTSEDRTWGVGGGGGGGLNYFRAHIHRRFRHAHHETRDWYLGLASRGKGRECKLLGTI